MPVVYGIYLFPLLVLCNYHASFSSMVYKTFSALSACLFLFSCRPPEVHDFSSLTEEQKRLPENALAGMTVTSGLEVNLFASEPMVTNPTNISVDEKGRVWICEAYNYDVSPGEEDKKGDRILVLEDTDGNGAADKRTVFYQGQQISTPLGIMAAGDKVYITNTPDLLVFTDTDGDLKADKIDTLFTNMKKGEHSAHSMFPGPDGKFYFSMGNYTGEIHDAEGNTVRDKAGFTVRQTGDPYRGGMVTRFAPDGSAFEVVGHNFRNNFEPCIDSYGNIWQSDNDDDGNESCRINFVMPYGNYGFYDDVTGARWTTHRIGLEEKIPDRHWHQNDPGVVPNVAITGAGSPSGMTFYEGALLPESFQGMPIHAEPYYNVVRAYLPEKVGAGYSISIKDILKSQDQWFRPVDVAIAPDGSLFIADWYDPILGGGAAADAVKGRIYRVAQKASQYFVKPPDLSGSQAAITALQNPNMETRYLALKYLEQGGENARAALREMWKSKNPVFRARALWPLSKMEESRSFLLAALQDENPDIKIAAIRAVLQNQDDVVSFLKQVAKDRDPHVRREVATSLRYTGTPQAAALWVDLANQYAGPDRWYIEALGIGADLHPDVFFETWLNSTAVDLNNRSHQDIIWRSRSSKAIPLLGELIKAAPDVSTSLRYFRAFDFHRDSDKKNEVLISLTRLARKDGIAFTALALQQLDEKRVKMTTALRKSLNDALIETKGSISFVNLAEKFNSREKSRDLLAISAHYGGKAPGPAATDLLLKFGNAPLINAAIHQDDSIAGSLLKSLAGKSQREVLDLLTGVIMDSALNVVVRQTAVRTLGTTWSGEERLLSAVKQPEFSGTLKPVAANVLFNVYRTEIQREAAQYLDRPAARGGNLPTIKELLTSNGKAGDGKAIFSKYCSSCHLAGVEGKNFGPPLTQIGQKLSREGLYRSILYPDEGISFGYESYFFTLQDGSQSLGIIASETDNDVELLQPGPVTTRLARQKIKSRIKNDQSLMPGLASVMSKQDLIDLVEYLSSLK